MSRLIILSCILPLLITGCGSTPDAMPPKVVDIFILDLSTSNVSEAKENRNSIVQVRCEDDDDIVIADECFLFVRSGHLGPGLREY